MVLPGTPRKSGGALGDERRDSAPDQNRRANVFLKRKRLELREFRFVEIHRRLVHKFTISYAMTHMVRSPAVRSKGEVVFGTRGETGPRVLSSFTQCDGRLGVAVRLVLLLATCRG